jgi:hypothetical protein
MTLTVGFRRPPSDDEPRRRLAEHGGNDGQHSCSRFLQLQRRWREDLRDFDTERRTDLVVPQVKQS